MTRQRVLVLKGGPSDEYKISLESGLKVAEALERRSYIVKSVTISRQGEWLEEGRPRSISQCLNGCDVVFVAMHGYFGEDGQVQRLLRRYGVPFTGSEALPSALAFNKSLAKDTLKKLGVKTPASITINRETLDTPLYSLVQNIKASFGPEYIIKPTNSGSSLGIKLVREGGWLDEALTEALGTNNEVLVEEFIRGKEATVPVLDNFRDQSVYAFPAIEIIPKASELFFSYHAKYSGETLEICPGNFSYRERDKLAEAAITAHTGLGLAQLSRSDFMVKDGEVYYLETNTIPGLTAESLVPKAAKAVGLSYDDLIVHLVETAS